MDHVKTEPKNTLGIFSNLNFLHEDYYRHRLNRCAFIHRVETVKMPIKDSIFVDLITYHQKEVPGTEITVIISFYGESSIDWYDIIHSIAYTWYTHRRDQDLRDIYSEYLPFMEEAVKESVDNYYKDRHHTENVSSRTATPRSNYCLRNAND